MRPLFNGTLLTYWAITRTHICTTKWRFIWIRCYYANLYSAPWDQCMIAAGRLRNVDKFNYKIVSFVQYSINLPYTCRYDVLNIIAVIVRQHINLSVGSDEVFHLTFVHVCYFKNLNPISSLRDVHCWINNAYDAVTNYATVFKSVTVVYQAVFARNLTITRPLYAERVELLHTKSTYLV